MIKNGICVCADGFYEDSSGCKTCEFPCMTCLSSDYCISCIIENSISLNGTCSCKSGFYNNPQLSGGFYCSACLTPCKTCLSRLECLTCIDDHQNITKELSCACNQGYYMNDSNFCENCNETCKTCSSKYKCIKCLNDTYELVNNLKCLSKCKNNLIRIGERCECRPGFRVVNEFCVNYYFDFKVKLDSSNKILLKFDQSLKKRLEHKNLKIKFSYNLDFKIFNETSSEIFIILDFKESFLANSTLFVEISQPIYSENNAKLKRYKFSLILNEFEYVDPEIKPFIETVRTISQIMVTISLGISLISTTAAAWPMIGILQLIPYIPLSEFYNDIATIQFFTAAGEFNVIPNLMGYIFDSKSSSTPYDRAKIVGIDTSVFWLNIGQIILPFIIFICLWPFLFFASKCDIRNLTLKLQKLLENYKYGLFLRYIIQAYLDIGVLQSFNLNQ